MGFEDQCFLLACYLTFFCKFPALLRIVGLDILKDNDFFNENRIYYLKKLVLFTFQDESYYKNCLQNLLLHAIPINHPMILHLGILEFLKK